MRSSTKKTKAKNNNGKQKKAAVRGTPLKNWWRHFIASSPYNYKFDPTRPSGFPKRVMDISLARELIDYRPSTSLLEGLKETWQWFVKNQDEYKKKKDYFTQG